MMDSDFALDVIDRIAAAHPHLIAGDGGGNLLIDWFAAALREFSQTREIMAFAPFMDDFIGPDLNDGFANFVTLQTAILAERPEPKLTSAQFKVLLGYAIKRCFGWFGTDAQFLWPADAAGSDKIDGLLFEYVELLQTLEPDTALSWAAAAIAPDRPLSRMFTANGTPVVIRLYRTFPKSKSGIGSAAANCFHEAVMAWCIQNPIEPGAAAVAADLLPTVFSGRSSGSAQIALLRDMCAPRTASRQVDLLSQVELQIAAMCAFREKDPMERYYEMAAQLQAARASNASEDDWCELDVTKISASCLLNALAPARTFDYSNPPPSDQTTWSGESMLGLAA